MILKLEIEEEYEVVGEAENGESALTLIDELKQDLILMDLSMSKMSGLEVIRALSEKGNQSKK